MVSRRPFLVIKGAGDLASGVVYRLFKSGFSIIMTELAQPMVVRRNVSFAEAVYTGAVSIEGILAVLADSEEQAMELLDKQIIPILIDPEGKLIGHLSPQVVVDATMVKNNSLTRITEAPLVVGLGPGFTAGKDVHAVIETKRGHYLGRALYEGSAIPNTGIPGEIMGYGIERLLKAPVDGIVNPCCKIGDLVTKDDIVAYVDSTPLKAALNGVVRGMLKEGIQVKANTKIGDIDPRREINYNTISEKALAIGGGVLEAVCRFCNTH
ncbi:MAG: selenium-dependent molybdenum cofactor biosynthesis protein YqeB [Syntrophomonas sp.]